MEGGGLLIEPSLFPGVVVVSRGLLITYSRSGGGVSNRLSTFGTTDTSKSVSHDGINIGVNRASFNSNACGGGDVLIL